MYNRSKLFNFLFAFYLTARNIKLTSSDFIKQLFFLGSRIYRLKGCVSDRKHVA